MLSVCVGRTPRLKQPELFLDLSNVDPSLDAINAQKGEAPWLLGEGTPRNERDTGDACAQYRAGLVGEVSAAASPSSGQPLSA